jgi:hypothetical protein
LEPFYKKYGIGYQPYTIFKVSRRFEHLSLIDLSTPDDLSKVGNELRIMVYEDILPFFEKNETLEKVHEYYSTLLLDEISSYFKGDWRLRVMTIKALLKTNDFTQFSKESIESYQLHSIGQYKHVFEPVYTFLPNLYEKLKTI